MNTLSEKAEKGTTTADRRASNLYFADLATITPAMILTILALSQTNSGPSLQSPWVCLALHYHIPLQALTPYRDPIPTPADPPRIYTVHRTSSVLERRSSGRSRLYKCPASSRGNYTSAITGDGQFTSCAVYPWRSYSASL